MPVQFSPKYFSKFLKFWLFVLVLSGGAVFLLWSYGDSSTAKPVSIDVGSDVSTLFPPRIAHIVPKSEATGILLGIEDPIVVTFAESVRAYYIRFELDPEAQLSYENNAEKTEFRLLPKEPLREGTPYTLKISYIPRETPEATYRPLAETRFTTLAAAAPEILELGAASSPIPRQSEGKYIDVDLKRQTMVLFEEGVPVATHIISSGKPGMDTPTGEFTIANKALRPWSKTYGLYMPFWMAITADGKFGIHELPEWPGGYKEGASHLGRPVSHGCIRLGVGSAEKVYEWTQPGTRVVVH